MKVPKARPGSRRRRRKTPRKKAAKIRLAGFGPLVAAFAIFLIINSLMFVVTSVYPSTIDYLSLAPDRPWGIFTSAFIHANVEHLVNNLEGFTLACTLFVFVILSSSPESRRRSSRLFLWLIFISGFLADGVEFLVWRLTGTLNVSSFGASGIVYAAIGVLLASALYSFPKNAARIRELVAKRKQSSKFIRDAMVPAFAMLTFVVLLFELVSNPADFFSAAPGIDVFAHEMGFLIGYNSLAIVLMWLTLTKRL